MIKYKYNNITFYKCSLDIIAFIKFIFTLKKLINKTNFYFKFLHTYINYAKAIESEEYCKIYK